ncbi:MAG: Phosphonate-transporting ATPase [Acidimicrobiaceae bacterium]|jgi:ABC-type antimicrobial peptide transport system permease subunit|nr:Phosphonate-transporting ATPase [Acidimicrobiaceae bacterium]
MGWGDALAMARKELLRRPGRAVLTMVSVALAASLLTALIAIATTARTRVLDQITNGGPLASISVSAAAPNPSQAGLDNPTPGNAKPITPAALAAMRALHDVTSVLPVVQDRVIIVPPARPPSGSRLCVAPKPVTRCGAPPTGAVTPITVAPYSDTIVGVDLRKPTSVPVSLLAGNYPATGSMTEVDVTQSYLSHLGIAEADAHEIVGTDVEIGAFSVVGRGFRIGLRWTTAEIVGVVDQQAGSGQILAYPALVLTDFAWTETGRSFGDRDAPTSPYAAVLVEADQLAHVEAVRTAIAAVGYSSSAPQDVVVSVEKYLHVIEIILTAIGAVALVIAALGIANALLAAVRERRREIGVMKAIGARDRDIMRTFLIEAGFLGLVGGALGSGLGIAVFYGIGEIANSYLAAQALPGVPITLAWEIPIGAIVGAMVISVGAGAIPARRASRVAARQAVEA